MNEGPQIHFGWVLRGKTGASERPGHLWRVRKVMSAIQKERKQPEEVKSECLPKTRLSRSWPKEKAY